MGDRPVRAEWWIAIGLSLGPAVSNGLARFAYGLILPAMRDDLAWSYTQAGWINTANALGYVAGALLAIGFIDRIGARRLFTLGIALATGALFFSALVRDFWLQSAVRLIAGIGGAPTFIAGGAMAATLFPQDARRSALAVAVYYGGGGLGMFVTGAILPVLLEQQGVRAWPQAWLIVAVLSAVACWPALLAVRATSPREAGAYSSQKSILPFAKMAYLLSGYFLFAIGYIVYLTFLVAWMRNGGAGARTVAVTWCVLGLAVMASPFPWRAALARANGGGALALASIATGLGSVLPLFIAGWAGLLLSAAVFGLSFFIGPAAITAFVRKNLPPGDWGRSVALFTLVFAAGQTLGPIAAGAIADATASLGLGIAAAGVVLVAAAGVAALQKRLPVG